MARLIRCITDECIAWWETAEDARYHMEQPGSMNFNIGVPYGDEVNTTKMNGDEMRKILREMYDFKNETCRIEHFLNGKVHPEVNQIEIVWSQAKRYTKAYCKYSLAIVKNIPKAFDSITRANYCKKLRQYIYICLLTWNGM